MDTSRTIFRMIQNEKYGKSQDFPYFSFWTVLFFKYLIVYEISNFTEESTSWIVDNKK